MIRGERTAHWREIIELHEASGLSGATFCREHNVNSSRFYHRHRRLRQDSLGGFLEITSDLSSARLGLATAGVSILPPYKGLCISSVIVVWVGSYALPDRGDQDLPLPCSL